MKTAAAIILTALLIVPFLAAAQQPTEVRLTVTADRTRLFVGESLTLRVQLEGPNVEYQGPFPIPDLMPYLWLTDTSPPSTSQNMQLINGRMFRSGVIHMSYVFEAKQAGTVTIAPIRTQCPADYSFSFLAGRWRVRRLRASRKR